MTIKCGKTCEPRSPLGLEPVLIDGDTDGLHVRQHADERHLDLVQWLQQAFRLARKRTLVSLR